MGKQPFSDYALGIREALSGETPKKAKFARHINDQLKINDLKHMNPTDEDEVRLDTDISALGAILKAIANHRTLVPENPDYIKAMLQWTWLFFDGEKITENEPYKEPAGAKMLKNHSVRPEFIKAMEARFAKTYQDQVGSPKT
jgi:hypothetical protein